MEARDIFAYLSPSWRSALWHLGVGLVLSGQKEQAVEAYIKSYRGGEVETVRRSVIEQLYKSVNGSLAGLEERIGPGLQASTPPAAPPTAEPTSAPELKTTPEPAPAEPPKTETTTTPAPATPESSQPMSEESLRNAASRLRSNVKITGRIVDADKVGIANVTVVLISPSGTVLAGTTDNEGNYSFTVAPSQKTYRIIPSLSGYTFTPVDRTFAGLYDDLKAVDFVGTKP